MSVFEHIYFRKVCWIYFLAPSLVLGQPAPDAIPDQVFKGSVKSVQLHRKGWELSYPVIELNQIDHVHLSFDDLTDEIKNYSYTLVHCDAAWRPSILSKDEYIDGFPDHPFYDYRLSFNTHVNYVHYTLDIPNDEMALRISGNYILKVFEDFDEENVVMTKRFVVSEPVVSIDASVSRPVMQQYMDSGHEVGFSVYYGSLDIQDPFSEISVTICQNNRWDLAMYDLKPLFYKEGVLDYHYQEENVFPAGNEYRYFDIKSLRYQSEYVKNIEYIIPYYHVELFPDQPRSQLNYFYWEDLNGRFYIDIQEGRQGEIEADYVYVHFSLPYDAPMVDGDFYVFGYLSNWKYGDANRLEYNFDRKAYELTLQLKQGLYNYEYIFVPHGTTIPDAGFLEGNHYETENDYVIYVYFRTNTSRYDRVIGYQLTNSQR
jgi:hypothetical protein